jgi:hypothetical protein
MTREEWKPIPGFEEFYSISDLGRVRRDSARYATKGAGHIMSLSFTPKGYAKVGLSRPGIRITRYCHHLVAESFLGPRPEGMEINHIDGNKKNNHASNLEYVTPGDNLRHGYHMGLISRDKKLRGESANGAKLSENQARDILHSPDQTKILAEKYGVDRTAIQKIRSGRTWAHLREEQK